MTDCMKPAANAKSRYGNFNLISHHVAGYKGIYPENYANIIGIKIMIKIVYSSFPAA